MKKYNLKVEIDNILFFLKPFKKEAVFIFILLLGTAVLETASLGAFYPFVKNILPAQEAGTNVASGHFLGFIEQVSEALPFDDKVISASVLLLGLIGISSIVGFLSESVIYWYRYKLDAQYLNSVFRRIINRPYGYFVERKHGDIVYLGLEASLSVGEMLLYFPKVGGEFLKVIVLLIALTTVSWEMTLIILLLTILFGGGVHRLTVKVSHPLAVRSQAAKQAVTQKFTESITGIKPIKLFNMERFRSKNFAVSTQRIRAAETKSRILGTTPKYAVQFLGGLSVIGIVILMRLSKPDQFFLFLPILSVYVLALLRILPLLNVIGNHWIGLRSLGPRLAVTREGLSDSRGVVENGGEKQCKGFNSSVTMKDMSFSYPDRREVLEKLNLTIKKGETLGIVGESGSGKSTLVDIITGIYRPTTGHVLIDEVNYLSLDLIAWREKIGVVSQETFIFHASLIDNIRFGRVDATTQEIVAVTKMVGLSAFIDELPDGYETVVGPRGVRMSGGQRQKVAIARALIRNPELLILDEATSSLDNISEREFQIALEKVDADVTKIIVAHRLSTLEHCDRIVVLQSGNIVEEGNETELLSKRGVYYRMHTRQSSLSEIDL